MAGRWWRWILGAVVGFLVVVVGGVFVYIHFIQGPPPAKLTLGRARPVGAALTASQVDGTWVIGAGSQAGYRVKEVLAGQNNTAVGRTSRITGSLTLKAAAVSAATFTVDLRTVQSDSSERDGQFNGRIMNTAEFPSATFTLTKPIALGSIPKVNQTVSVQGVGTLAMHGVTKPVTVTMQARDTGSAIVVSGDVPVVFANWNIANPSFGSFVKTDNDGLVEFALRTQRS